MNHGFGTWAVMMIAMMAPAEAPSVLRLTRGRTAFLLGFAAPWIAFSLAAAALQLKLHEAGLLDHESGALTNPWLAAALLSAAAALQFTPLKRACRETQPQGSLAGGARAAALSMASCGALMLVPFATGMSLWPMVLVTALLFAERVAPRQWPVSSLAGALLAGAGAWLTLQGA